MYRATNCSGLVSAALAVILLAGGLVFAAESGKRLSPLALEEPPQYGVYFNKAEPAFYTGFALRCQDPNRIHLHVGRGNQLRVTVVLSPEALRYYARDLLHRYDTYRTLLDKETLILTQNRFFEEFEQTIKAMEIARLVSEEQDMTETEIRARNLNLLEKLNPGRVFRIRMPVDSVIKNWASHVRSEDQKSMNNARLLELVNLMLPTRLFIAEISQPEIAQLKKLVTTALSVKEQPSNAEAGTSMKSLFLSLFSTVTGGIYPLENNFLVFPEFTAIYPIGTLNDFTKYRGQRIPLYPAPGRRSLTTHQRTKTVDHIPTIDIYSYFPWIPYMHVGTKLHNSFHTLWWKMPTTTSFVPENWQQVTDGSRSGKPLRFLWLLSRGPMSHGCTHLNAGHISEFRQILPSETERLYRIDNFRNKSYHYDVFDIDGDFIPEVMGVRYFIAFSLKNKKPDRLRVRNERKAYYEWLYAGELQYRADGTPFFPEVRDARFKGRRALEGTTYEDISLYEAAYEPERVQFFRMVDIPFVRKLRKTAVTFPDGFQPDPDLHQKLPRP